MKDRQKPDSAEPGEVTAPRPPAFAPPVGGQLTPQSVLALQRSAGNAAVSRAILSRQDLEPADVGTAAVEGPGAAAVFGMEAAVTGIGAAIGAGLEWLFGGAAGGAGAGTATQTPGPAPANGAGPAPAAGAGSAPAAAPVAEPTIRYGTNADASVMTANSTQILKDVLKASGHTSCTITSTARSAADQARAMYQNLVGTKTAKGQGVEGQRKLYGPAGDKVIDVFVKEKEAGKTPEEIKQAMTDKILELGPAKVSRHCADQSKLNVFDVGPSSIGDHAKFRAAAKAEVGRRVSNFIDSPPDPGFHFEIKV